MKLVMVYMCDWCGFCVVVFILFKKKEIVFDEINVMGNVVLWVEMIECFGGGNIFF